MNKRLFFRFKKHRKLIQMKKIYSLRFITIKAQNNKEIEVILPQYISNSRSKNNGR